MRLFEHFSGFEFFLHLKPNPRPPQRQYPLKGTMSQIVGRLNTNHGNKLFQENNGKMIGAHAYGIDHSYKKINKTQAKCLVCGEYSEFQILKYEKYRHIFYIKVKTLEEQFWFDWEKCRHRAILFDKQDVARYKQEQVDTGTLLVPYYQNMRLHITEVPKRMHVIKFVLLVIGVLSLGVLLGVLIEFIFNKLGIPIIPI